MSTDFAQHTTTRSGLLRRQRPESADRPGPWEALVAADHACCCSARAAVVVVMPPAAGRQHATELLLCGHHYRASRQALAAAGASAFDRDGVPVTPPRAALVGAR
jgi:hypothetical protein